jgi:predicted  nucleic acid-binding Zn-ribbon protein
MENTSNKQMKVLELQNAISEIKVSLDELKSKVDTQEENIMELEDRLIKSIQSIDHKLKDI